jgi:FixJ family two-component response regulator
MGRMAILVYVIDDDESVRRAYELLMQSSGFDVKVFPSADDFLRSEISSINSCIIMDMRRPGFTGSDFQKELAYRKISIPVIAISAQDDEQIRRSAQESGAVVFFSKPVDGHALIDTILWATRKQKKDDIML